MCSGVEKSMWNRYECDKKGWGRMREVQLAVRRDIVSGWVLKSPCNVYSNPLNTCDIREDRKCTQYLTIQLNTTWFFNYLKVGNNLSVPRAMLQLIKQSVVDVVKTSGVSHVWIFTHMSTVHFLLRQKRVYTTSSIFDVQPAHFQLLCLHLVPMLIIMRGLKITFKWYFLFW